MNPQLTELLWGLGLRLPVMAVALAGIGWSVLNWKKAPAASLFTALACAILLLSGCIITPMFVYFPRMMAENAPAADAFNRIIMTNRMILGAANLCFATSVGVLIFAVFAGRASTQAVVERDRPPPLRDKPETDPDDRIKAV